MSTSTSQPWMKQAEKIAREAYAAALTDKMPAALDALAAAGFLRNPNLAPGNGPVDLPIWDTLRRERPLAAAVAAEAVQA